MASSIYQVVMEKVIAQKNERAAVFEDFLTRNLDPMEDITRGFKIKISGNDLNICDKYNFYAIAVWYGFLNPRKVYYKGTFYLENFGFLKGTDAEAFVNKHMEAKHRAEEEAKLKPLQLDMQASDLAYSAAARLLTSLDSCNFSVNDDLSITVSSETYKKNYEKTVELKRVCLFEDVIKEILREHGFNVINFDVENVYMTIINQGE